MKLRLTLLMLALAAIAPPAASASPILVVGPDGDVRQVDDPNLPPPEATDPLAGLDYCETGVRRAPRLGTTDPPVGAAASVTGAISAARRRGAISDGQARGYRSAWSAGRRAVRRLRGTRRGEQRAVVNIIASLAARDRLTASRMPIVFLTLRRNTEYWTSGKPLPLTPPPAGPPSKRPCAGQAGQGGARVTFTGDPVVFQWYRGQGLHVQQLANFGQANALWTRCAQPTPNQKTPCDPAALRRLLDRMADIASSRGGFKAWEYFFPFGGGPPPWISGLAQGTGIQAFARGFQLLGEERYKRVGRDALGAFRKSPPTGVRVKSGNGSHYLIYSMAPGLRVLNGFLQAVTGLYDFAATTGDSRARALFRAGDRAARREIPRYDTGAWSLYSLGGRESDLGYHRLVRSFLNNLCERTRRTTYCRTARKFLQYQRENPVVGGRQPRGARVRRPVRLRFSVSKISCTTVRVFRDGRRVFFRRRVLGRGGHEALWVPRQKGDYEVRYEAIDLMNHKITVAKQFRVR